MPIIYKAFQATESWQREGVKRETARFKAQFSAIPIHADKAQRCEGDQYWLDMAECCQRVTLMLMSQPKSDKARERMPVYPRKSLQPMRPEDRWRLVEDEDPYFFAIDGGAARTERMPSGREKLRLSLVSARGPLGAG